MNTTNATYLKRKEYHKRWRELNREAIRQKARVYKAANTEHIKNISKQYRSNPSVRKSNYEQWYRNKERYKAAARIRYQQNKDKINAKRREVYALQKNNSQYKLANNLRSRIRIALKSQRAYKSQKTEQLLGCSISEARTYIEALWQPGMNWSNYAHDTWHIDHIRPCNTFDLTDLEQQEQCFHYTNLRPLWATDNLSRPKDGSDIHKKKKSPVT